MKNYLFLLPATLALLLSGCASLPMADKEHDRQAKAFAPKANMANIYVHTEPGFYNSGGRWELIIDGQMVGIMNRKTYLFLEVPQGSHTVAIESIHHWGRSKEIDIDAEEGKNYFFEVDKSWLQPSDGERPLHQVDETIGRQEISKCVLGLVPENVNQKIAVASKRREKKNQEAAIQRNFARPDKIIVPRPIAGNSGKYRSPYSAAGTVALWAQNPVSGTDNGSDLAASVGGAVGQQVTQKALDFIPFGLGGMIGQKAGESAARAATKKNIEPELPGMDAVSASSDISFNSADELAVYMYAKNSAHGQYARVLALTQRVYPELQDAYTSAIEKASQASDSRKEKSADERLDALKKLKEKGLITDADYLAKKNKIIDAM